ncbi:MAG: hypothetical protein JKY52_04100 [Flavobacteriales bacterium]|nr:hypothetical protein [Flavobacteriales bacterium]
MKRLLPILLCFTIACNSDRHKELPSALLTSEAAMDADSLSMSCVVLNYQYLDHNKFLNWIDGSDSLRSAFGLKAHSIFRILNDTSRVLELLTVDNIANGYDFARSSQLKQITESSGFVSRPTVYLLNAVHMGDKEKSATCMLLQHDVQDFDTWRKDFEAYNRVNDNDNMRALCIFSTYKNPNKASVLMEIKNVEMAKMMASSPELDSTMRAMGATTKPRMTLLEVYR